MQLLGNSEKYNKEHNAILKNHQRIEDFLNSEEGIKTRHEFVERIGKRYNMDYTTNL